MSSSAIIPLLIACIAAAAGAGIAGLMGLNLAATPPQTTTNTTTTTTTSKSSYATAIATGAAVGAALGVVIPEGIELVGISSSPHDTMATLAGILTQPGVLLAIGFAATILVSWIFPSHAHHQTRHNTRLGTIKHTRARVSSDGNETSDTAAVALHTLRSSRVPSTTMLHHNNSLTDTIIPTTQQSTIPNSIEDSNTIRRPNVIVPQSSTLSSSSSSTPPPPPPPPPHLALAVGDVVGDGIGNIADDMIGDTKSDITTDSDIVAQSYGINSTTRISPSPFAAVLGLIAHSAADGLALGAAASAMAAARATGNDSSHLSMTDTSPTNAAEHAGAALYVAMVLHRVPAAFALGSLLAVRGSDLRAARRTVILFACVTPIAAIISFVGILAATRGLNADPNMQLRVVGRVVLIAAGSFCHAALVHMLPPVLEAHHGTMHVPLCAAAVVATPILLGIL